MQRLALAMLLAFCCHGIFILLPIANDKPLTPRLPGDNTIKIKLVEAVAVESKFEDSVSEQSKSQDESNQHQVKVLPIIQPENEAQQPDDRLQHIPESLQEKQKSYARKIIKPQAKKVILQPKAVNILSSDSSAKEKMIAKIPQPSQNVGNTTFATAAPAIVKARPLYQQNPKPVYPALARRRGRQGTVILKVTVLKNGMPDHVMLHKSSGYEMLDRSALITVKTWRFLPGSENGQPVTMEVLVPIHFKLY